MNANFKHPSNGIESAYIQLIDQQGLEMNEQDLHNCFSSNMAYFRDNIPKLYQQISEYNLTYTQIEGRENGHIDLRVHGKLLYRGSANDYAEQEVSKFTQQLAPGAKIRTITPPASDSYSGKRYFFRNITRTLEDLRSSFGASDSEYTLDDNYPMIVVMGIGLGLHIQKLIERKSIQTLFVVEPDIERFIASCYVTDWGRVFAQFNLSQGKQFAFILPFSAKKPNDVFVAVWNELIHYAPRFPVTTLFYNHKRTRANDFAIKKFHEDHHVFLSSWGNYDDELNQLNHALHNFRSKREFLKPRDVSSLTEEMRDVPVVIVGGGPSVDEKIDWIKENREKIFLISAGSSLRTIAHHGLKPDLHAELESDYNTATMYEFIGKEYMEDLVVIGPTQLSPIAFNYFDQCKMFFKDSTCHTSIFESDNPTEISHATPTCTNTAVAVAFYYQFKNIYLIGVDLSYKSIENTHASGSIYFDPDAPDVVKHAMDLKKYEPRFKDINTKGEEVLTEAIYFTTKRRIENGLIEYGKICNTYNLSGGLQIAGTQNIESKEEFEEKIASGSDLKQQILKTLFQDHSMSFDEEQIQSGLENLYQFVEKVCNETIGILSKIDGSKISMDKGVFLIAHLMENHITKHSDKKYYFMRGCIWHYLYAGYSFAYAMDSNDPQLTVMINKWKEHFHEFLVNLPEHLRIVTQRQTSEDDDVWLYRSIHEEADYA